MGVMDKFATEKGGGAHDGSEENPWSYEEAWKMAKPSDRINVKAGTWPRQNLVTQEEKS